MLAPRPSDDRIELAGIDPFDIKATDEIASDLGLDRGELLSLYRVILFVEGATDVAVLEHLFQQRIRDIGLLSARSTGCAACAASRTRRCCSA